MTFNQYKIAFIEEAKNSGFSEQNIIHCLKYAEILFVNNVPVIYNTTHLSSLVGYKKEYLKRAVSFTNYFYRSFEVSKKNGKKRLVSEPLPSLKDIQLWILNNLLNKIPVSRYAKAYVSGQRIKNHVNIHRKQPLVLTMDIEDFFPSIILSDVEKVFLSVGYSKLISNLLAKLCCNNESLPQGAPTSPYLSNIILKNFDETIFSYSKGKEIRYSRYADDLTFSGSFDFKEIQEFVEKQLNKIGFNLNKEKTKVMKPHERQVVTGVVVNQFPQVSFEKRNAIRQEFYYIKKFGIKGHMEKKNITKANYLEHLIGKINFILTINPKDQEFIDYKKFLIDLKQSK